MASFYFSKIPLFRIIGAGVEGRKLTLSSMTFDIKYDARSGATKTSIHAPYGWTECINIGSRQDELGPTILEKLPAPSVVAVASVHKYWTFSWAKAADNTDLSELAEINTTQSRILNCKLYKVLAMKVDKLRSTATDSKDIDELHLENKIIRSRFAIFEEARAQAEFKIIKSEMIQRLSVITQK
ncbi:hypothetical protein Fot_42355 [Forsythia ovata]|uniref:Uncharacterized protein n=1 Tax=Forsythia ovata TaxID=205694 RepID=A0ABD1RKX6_9LAMI